MSALSSLQAAVRTKDIPAFAKAITELRLAGCTYQQCYRYALAGDPTLTQDEWNDLLIEADLLDGP